MVAPSLIPSRPGDRVKTNAAMRPRSPSCIARGELTPVWVPDGAHEAMRDLVRARATARRVLGEGPPAPAPYPRPLVAFGWTRAYRRWLTTVRFDHPAQQIVLQDYIHAVRNAEVRLQRLEPPDRGEQPPGRWHQWSRPVQAMRGVALIVATTVVAEVGDFSRFANPRSSWPTWGWCHRSARAAAASDAAASPHARRGLIEGAWTYRMQARVSRKLLDRIERLPQAIRDIAWRAQLRLCHRYRRLAAAGKPKPIFDSGFC